MFGLRNSSLLLPIVILFFFTVTLLQISIRRSTFASKISRLLVPVDGTFFRFSLNLNLSSFFRQIIFPPINRASYFVMYLLVESLENFYLRNYKIILMILIIIPNDKHRSIMELCNSEKIKFKIGPKQKL